ncbi:aromatic-L-amino-acid decarboxylase-like [Glandiceps talaboti]
MDLCAKLENLEKEARGLELGPDDRKEMTKNVTARAENFLEKLENIEYEVYIKPGDKASSGILKHPITEQRSHLDDIFDAFESTVLKSGIQISHGMHLGFVPGGALYPAALGDYFSAVTNKLSGMFYTAPEAVRLENMLIAWVASLLGYPSNHAGNLTSGGTPATLIAIQTARDSMKIRGRDYERVVVYQAELTHYCVRKCLSVLGMNDVIIREISMDEKTLTMNVSDLRDQIKRDKEQGLKPFLIAASVGTVYVGSVDPIDQIAEVAEECNVWLHVDAAYGGFFVLVDDAKHHFKGVERSDSVVMDPHKGLFLPYGSGIVLVRDGRKLFEANVQTSNTSILQDGAGIEEYSPCDLSFELAKHSRGLRMWLPLKLFGIRPFAAALEEKILLAKYFHQKLSGMDGFVADPVPVFSAVVFYYDTKDNQKNEDFNKELLARILQDGRVFISSANVRGKYHLRICVMNFRSHRKHIDLCLKIIQEKVKILKEFYAV